MEQKTLILGDENFTFSSQFLKAYPNRTVELTCCLAEDQIPDESRPNLKSLGDEGIRTSFQVNPALLRQHFSKGDFDHLLFVLPGVAFQGCPSFVDKNDPLFKLRLHLYSFGFMKSCKPSIKAGGLLQILWPDQESPPHPDMPFPYMDLDKLGPFCKILRTPNDDVSAKFSRESCMVYKPPGAAALMTCANGFLGLFKAWGFPRPRASCGGSHFFWFPNVFCFLFDRYRWIGLSFKDGGP
eukprot:GHVN01013344.1.p1 GENE.GHVN01013344.1~~GHVN01013344.1.p1  ORF type:complete len:240 (+),score=9.91 GHVN01013344.1:46-765(+)